MSTKTATSTFSAAFHEEPEVQNSDRWKSIAIWAGILVGVALDAILIQPILTVIIGINDLEAALAAGALAVVALLVARTAGVILRRANILGHSRFLGLALISGYLCFVAALFIVRLTSGIHASGAETDLDSIYGTTGEGATSDVESVGGTNPTLTAILLLAMLACTGLLALYEGWREGNPVLKAYRNALANLKSAKAAEENLTEEVASLAGAAANGRHELDSVGDRAAMTAEHITGMVDRAKEHARRRVAEALGDPSATDMLRPDDDPPKDQG